MKRLISLLLVLTTIFMVSCQKTECVLEGTPNSVLAKNHTNSVKTLIEDSGLYVVDIPANSEAVVPYFKDYHVKNGEYYHLPDNCSQAVIHIW